MIQASPQILALDFDGVICDGILEYFQTTKRTYETIWKVGDRDRLDQFADQFYRLRPVIETGWEMPILLRALVLEIPNENILDNWPAILKNLLESDQLDKSLIIQNFDKVRDEWITQDLDSWLGLHCFYPGVIERLKQMLNSSTQLYIISTKESRFTQTLLAEQGVLINPQYILGKEVKQPKYKTLRQILDQNQLNPEQLWFVEDLLKTLQLVADQPNLNKLGLFLADWGYNTQLIRDSIQNNPQIKLLSLSRFNQDFSCW
jgi:phosphoglycolate phosphatase-like HAD superfamily hydrolase